MPFADSPDAFAWVDDYFANVRPHFDVRRRDQLLIVLPNRAVKLNRSGLAILRFLREGGSIGQLLDRIGPQPQRRADLFHFLCDFRSMINNCLGEGRERRAVRVVPFDSDFNCLPVLSEIAVTYRCNLRCRFCYAACGCRGAGEGPAGSELSTRQVIRLLEIIRRQAEAPSVSFTGGEPAMRDDLEELVAAARAVGLRCNLITNGTLIDRQRADQLHQAGLASAQVSLEGPDAAVHDALTGVEGSFDQTMAGLAALRRAGIHTHTNTTINAVNAPHLADLVDLLADLGLRRMSANLVIPSGMRADPSLQVSYTGSGRSWKGSATGPGNEASSLCGIRRRPCACSTRWPMAWATRAAPPATDYSASRRTATSCRVPAIHGQWVICSGRTSTRFWNSAQAVFFRRKKQAPEQCGMRGFPCLRRRLPAVLVSDGDRRTGRREEGTCRCLKHDFCPIPGGAAKSSSCSPRACLITGGWRSFWCCWR